MKDNDFPKANYSRMVKDGARELSRKYVLLVLSFLFALSFVPVAAGAAEMGYIRLGNDYAFRSVPVGQSYRWCQRQCAKDDKCKSWTFLRPSHQCRLKSAVAPKYQNDCCVSGTKTSEQGSSQQKLCRKYANQSIADYEKNLVQNCGLSSERWTGDFATHFDWCMGATVEEKLDLRRQRKNALRQCLDEKHGESSHVGCRQYAKKALQQQQTNLRNKCGFNSKIRWRNSFSYYLNWCQENTVHERKRQDKMREEAIGRCLKRGGGVYSKKCDNYAKFSLKQVKRASKNGCGFRDRGRWSRTYKFHYQFCRKTGGMKALQKEKVVRKEGIKRCEADLGGLSPGNGDGDEAEVERSAIEFGTLRIGFDYSYKTVPKGADHLWCDESCRRDPRCKAWAYIKKVRQCRLKYRKGSVLKNKCCISGVRGKRGGGGDKSQRCSDYAVRVIDLYSKSLKNKCFFEDKAWDNKFKNHYRFCMSKPFSTVEKDLKAKRVLLAQCRKGEWQLDRICSAYARQSVAQNRMNLTHRCGFTNRKRWSSSFSKHYDWCSNHSRFDRRHKLDKRKDYLAACIHRGGGRYSKTCDGFAKMAVKDVAKAAKLKCNFSGREWSGRYKDHYQWCLNADNLQRRSEVRARNKAMKRCQKSGGNKSRRGVICDHFARLSAEQSRSESQYNCGLRSPIWKLADIGNLKKWCLKVAPTVRKRRFRQREEQLEGCFERFGSEAVKPGKFNKACDDYAQTALRQYRKGVAQNCHLRGEEWSSEYDDHYSWCLKVSPFRRKRLIFSRKAVLKTCQFGSFFGFGQ